VKRSHNRRVVNIKILPGEPADGTGIVCIHLFVEDERGPFIEPCVLHIQDIEVDGQVTKRPVPGPTRGRLACDPNRTVAPVTHKGVTTVTMRTGDPRAVTCPKCRASKYYTEAMELLESVVK